MLNAFILKLSVFFFLLMAVYTASGQSVFEGQVFDKGSEKPLQSVTVALLKTKIVTLTSQQGYFNIQAEDVDPLDTLAFSSVGFTTFKLAVVDYKENLFVVLESTASELEEVVITNKKLKQERLRGFTIDNISNSPGNSGTSRLLSFIYAKLFDSRQSNVLLTQIELGRSMGGSSLLKVPVQTRFLIHVMEVDDNSGFPGRIILTKKVHLTDRAYWVTIDLSPDKIILPSNRFFIAIECQQIPFNEMVGLSNVHRLYKIKPNGKKRLEQVSNYVIQYQPLIIEYHRDKPAISYTKLDKGFWKINKYDDKNGGLEVALSVTIKY